MTELEQAIDREAATYIARVLAAVALAEREGFSPAGTDVELQMRAPKAYWGSYHSVGPHAPGAPYRLFRDRQHPYATALAVIRSYHPGKPDTSWDFLRHQYTVDGTPLEVFDGVNEVLIRVKGHGAALLPMAPAERVTHIARIAAILFEPPWSTATWLPRASAGEDGGIAFSTAPASHPMSPTTALDRLDAGVLHGDLFYLSYKLHNLQQGVRMRSPRSWSE